MKTSCPHISLPQEFFDSLPEELVIGIFGHLSPRYLCVAKVVCRKWNQVIGSTEFLSKYVYTYAPGPTLACIDANVYDLPFTAAVNIELKRWVYVPPFFKGYKAKAWVDAPLNIVAHAEGLYVYDVTPYTNRPCVADDKLGKSQLLIRNPLTNTNKLLPPMVEENFTTNFVRAGVVLEIIDGGEGTRSQP